ncbi:AraC family transcriptional regulator [Paenibacillus illinoisensis]|uniref:AraC family transcriptional regulator n=1 Tax=Paenibacillus illinoisensis TaxID=59845 RepID=UPI00301B4E96
MNRVDLISYLNEHRLYNPDIEMMLNRELKTIDVEGVAVFLFDKSYDINDALIEDKISMSQQMYGADIPLHMHDYIEMIFVYRGHGVITVEGHVNLLQEGNLMIIDKFTPHMISQISDEDVIINITMKKDFLSPSFLSRLTKQNIISQFMMDSVLSNRKHNHFLVFKPEKFSQTTEILENMMCEFFEKDYYSDEIIDSYLVILFSILVRSKSQQQKSRVYSGTKEQVTIVDFLHYIEGNYKENCTLVDMGQHFGFHPNYLSSLLKKGTGKSFKELLQIQRLTQASLFLTNTDLTIPEIAEEVGYSSLTFFYKKFKEFFLETPHNFRLINKTH